MKKVLSILTLASICILVSCSGKKDGSGGMSAKAKKNMETNDAIMKMFEGGDWSKAGDYIAKDGVDHASATGKDVVGLDSIMASFNQMGAMMGNMKNEIVKVLADDDYVMCWAKETATAKIDMPEMGMKKGQTNTYNAIEVSKFNADSKVAEHWSFMDMNEMMKMMGSMGGQNMNHMKDSTGNK